MSIKYKIFKNLYQDSVSLMQISAQINQLAGIEQASVLMGTSTNLQQLEDAGLMADFQAGPNDLVIVVKGEDNANTEALELAEQHLTSKPQVDTDSGLAKQANLSIAMAVQDKTASNLALISVPGDYATNEAIKALNLGLNVMLFSDNVSLEQEKAIKLLAKEKQRLVMGPDCGTAIVNGLPLGFANVVNRGKIGVIAASGTGLQEVTCRIDQLGEGISQALGTGGHDLHEQIGGISMCFALEALAQDPDTAVIVLISKPPAKQVAEKLLHQAQHCSKPVVVNFLGAPKQDVERSNVLAATTLADAAEIAVSIIKQQGIPDSILKIDSTPKDKVAHISACARYLRGIFAGGTFCYESQLICQQQGIQAASNTPINGNKQLDNIGLSQEHTLIDMGDDDFTRGKPHPMIDPTLRNQRILHELQDPQTAVLLFDVVLGYGASADPTAGLIQVIEQAKQHTTVLPVIVAHVCGTEGDPQNRAQQIAALQQAGVLIAGCNAQAALWASHIVKQRAGA